MCRLLSSSFGNPVDVSKDWYGVSHCLVATGFHCKLLDWLNGLNVLLKVRVPHLACIYLHNGHGMHGQGSRVWDRAQIPWSPAKNLYKHYISGSRSSCLDWGHRSCSAADSKPRHLHQIQLGEYNPLCACRKLRKWTTNFRSRPTEYWVIVSFPDCTAPAGYQLGPGPASYSLWKSYRHVPRLSSSVR